MPRRLLVLLISALFLLAACGDDDEAATTPETETTMGAEVPPGIRAAIEVSLRGYFGGGTAAEVCSWMTRGHQAQVAGAGEVGDPEQPADANCEAEITRATEDGTFSLEPTQPKVEDLAVAGGLAAARVAGVEPGAYPVFLVESASNKWLIHGERQPPPNYEDLAAQVEG